MYANFNLKIGSFNIHGQGNKNQIKLRKIYNLFLRGNFDILLFQETRTDGSEKELKKWQKIFHSKQIYLTNFGTRSVGAGIVIRNEESFKVHQCFNDPQGRYVAVVGDHEEGKFLILSFYSPSVEKEIKNFVINSICAHLTSMGTDLPQFLILGGDTNTVFSNLDKEGGNPQLKNHAINSFETMKQNFGIFDTFRQKNPTKREYSWETLNPQIIKERIDIIFVSNSLQDYVTETGIVPVHKTCSDHGIPYVKIQGFGIPSRGPGLWKFNNQLLVDQSFVSELNEQLPKWVSEGEKDLPNDNGSQWGYIKHKIGEFSRDYGAKVKKAKLLIKIQLEKELKELQQNLNETNKERYTELQKQLNDIIENEVKGSILRSLCKEYESGEKCSKYFFSLEKFRSKQKTISRIKLAGGSFTSDPKLILSECRLFYKNLYSANVQVDALSFPFFYQNPTIPKLSEEQKINCDIDLTEEELFKTLKAFQKNKSPGMDGITAEFYITFWDLIKAKLFSVYCDAFVSGILPVSLRTGVITLLEKNAEYRLDIANWRPVTLLGIDYKLLTKTLGERLKLTLPGLVHKDQNGFVPGGNIFYSAHTIRDILFYCKKENLDLILLALDYSKAFDSVNFEFIHKTFELFNFGENFRKWIRIIFNGGKSCITNNGNISETFDIKRSTRQGDPISPLIFILCLEILFITIRSDENIKGFKVENNEFKLTSYADDASYFLKSKFSAEMLLKIIQKFSKISGLEVNKSKSECMLLEYEVGFAGLNDDLFGIPIVSNLKILGHFYGKDKIVCDYQNFYSKLVKMENIIKMWRQRPLTIIGKNVLINSLLNSSFLFNAQIDIPPPDFIKLVDKQNKDFLWSGGTAKIAHNTIIANYDKGGIRYKDLDCFISSINIKFLLNLTSTVPNRCAVLPQVWLNTMYNIPKQYLNENQQYFYNFFRNNLNILECKTSIPRLINWTGHPFYFKILKSFEKITSHLPKCYENILSIPLWFNKHLKTKFDVDISRAGFNF